jgi:hypothetical protein
MALVLAETTAGGAAELGSMRRSERASPLNSFSGTEGEQWVLVMVRDMVVGMEEDWDTGWVRDMVSPIDLFRPRPESGEGASPPLLFSAPVLSLEMSIFVFREFVEAGFQY